MTESLLEVVYAIAVGLGMATPRCWPGTSARRTGACRRHHHPAWINLVAFWLFQIPLAWLLSRSAGLRPQGVFWAIALAHSLSAVLGVVVFRRGLWQRRQV